MKKLLFSLAAVCLAAFTSAQDAPLWLRHCAISPDGTTIAFTYKGDIYTVPVDGGRAMQLTTNPAHDTEPVWSPDGKRIAFASDRMGSMDVYIVSKEGGEPRRLTTHSGSETPVAFSDAGHILFSADIMPSAETVLFPSNGQFRQVYKVSVEGGRPVLYSPMPMECISINKEGTVLYQDKKGYEDYWRKHQVSPIARDIWMYAPGEKPAYRQLTTFGGEDREPVWAPDGKSFYYLSEENGTFNVYRRTPGAASATQVTHHTKQPVRFLSIAADGRLCYGFDGEIYTLVPGGEPRKVNISIVSDKSDKDLIRQIKSSGATEMALSPNGKEVAFVLRGDVYVTSVDYKTTKQVTNTPCQERGVDFAPDGRSLVYASERGGLWQLYTSAIVRKDEKLFTYATELKEERLTNSEAASFQPQYSPDGKEVAFLENRAAIRVINLKTKAVRTVMDAKYQYSYSDGDQWFRWSPDSKWILSDFIGIGGWNNKDVVLLNADGKGEMVNLTESGYTDGNAKWVLGGKAMIWTSDRAGYRSHGSWGSEDDTYIMFFDAEAYDRFLMSKEETALVEEAEKAEKEAKEKAEKKKETKKKTDKEDGAEKEKKVEPLNFDLENRFDRIVRLTVNSSHLADAVLTPKGDALYYLSTFEDGYDLWKHDLKENSTKVLLKDVGAGALLPDKEGKNIFLCSSEGMKKIEVAGSKVTPVEFEAFFDYRPYGEREYIFDHVWQQVDDKFYVEDLQGTDWTGYKASYKRFLPYINNNYDFAELLSEWLGELNVSHTGGRYFPSGQSEPTASLGLLFDWKYRDKGMRIAEVIEKGPFDNATTKVKPGSIIEKIDGMEITPETDYYTLVNNKAKKKTLVSLYNPQTKERWEEVVIPISGSALNTLLYTRWVKQRAADVAKWSGGRLGYVHIESMGDDSFRSVYSDILGKYNNCEGIVIDTRFNGGGRLHEDIEILFSGKKYFTQVIRGREACDMPSRRWNKPSVMLTCEANYSNAHGTPWVYRHRNIGKLVGMPVPGTMTSVSWERLQDPSLVFGIPVVGYRLPDGSYLENSQLEPDIKVANSPETIVKGEDTQLKVAVEELLKELESVL